MDRIGTILLGIFVLQGCSTARPLPNYRRGLLDNSRAALTASSSRRAAPAVQSDKDTAMLASTDRDSAVALSSRSAARSSTRQMVRSSDSRGWKYQWPLESVELTSGFGRRKGEFHEGVDLRAASGTPVYAARSGIVLYAGGKIKGYGNLVVIRHKDRLATLYAHNSRLLVLRGQRVRRGQQIAISGNTGRSTGPHLHFEIRDGLTAKNPLRFLPPPTLTAKRDSNPRG